MSDTIAAFENCPGQLAERNLLVAVMMYVTGSHASNHSGHQCFASTISIFSDCRVSSRPARWLPASSSSRSLLVQCYHANCSHSSQCCVADMFTLRAWTALLCSSCKIERLRALVVRSDIKRTFAPGSVKSRNGPLESDTPTCYFMQFTVVVL